MVSVSSGSIPIVSNRGEVSMKKTAGKKKIRKGSIAFYKEVIKELTREYAFLQKKYLDMEKYYGMEKYNP